MDEALSRKPSILHLATHFLRSAGDTRQALAALSLDPAGRPNCWDRRRYRGSGVDLDLVVLSGCSSGAGEALPAEGLMGMTRAWLAAGSRSVLATLWPSPDDQGRLLVSFYSHLARPPDGEASWVAADSSADGATRHAVGRTVGYGCVPPRWGAYVLAGKE